MGKSKEKELALGNQFFSGGAIVNDLKIIFYCFLCTGDEDQQDFSLGDGHFTRAICTNI